MTDRKIVFERAIRNPEGLEVEPQEGWRFEYEDEEFKIRPRKIWQPRMRVWSPFSAYGQPTRMSGITYIVRIADD